MDLVVDANIIFAALIKDGGSARLMLHEKIHLFAPEFLLEELETYRDLILKKTHRSDNELDQVLSIMRNRIHFITMEEIKDHMKEAEMISPDIDDSPYFAASILLGADLWTNDRKLFDQKRIKVYSTSDLMNIFPK